MDNNLPDLEHRKDEEIAVQRSGACCSRSRDRFPTIGEDNNLPLLEQHLPFLETTMPPFLQQRSPIPSTTISNSLSNDVPFLATSILEIQKVSGKLDGFVAIVDLTLCPRLHVLCSTKTNTKQQIWFVFFQAMLELGKIRVNTL